MSNIPIGLLIEMLYRILGKCYKPAFPRGKTSDHTSRTTSTCGANPKTLHVHPSKGLRQKLSVLKKAS